MSKQSTQFVWLTSQNCGQEFRWPHKVQLIFSHIDQLLQGCIVATSGNACTCCWRGQSMGMALDFASPKLFWIKLFPIKCWWGSIPRLNHETGNIFRAVQWWNPKQISIFYLNRHVPKYVSLVLSCIGRPWKPQENLSQHMSPVTFSICFQKTWDQTQMSGKFIAL